MRLIDADAIKYDVNIKTYADNRTILTSLLADKDTIDAMPTIEPNRWIPVSERLPEEWQDVLVSFDKSITEWVNVGYMYRDEETFEYWFQSDGMSYKKDDVLAWMPLPDAYEEDENEV